MPKLWSAQRLTLGLVLLFIPLIVWSWLLYSNELRTTTWNYLFNVAVALFYILTFAIAMLRRKQRQISKSERRILLYFGLAALSWGIAFMIWTYYNFVREVNVPYPSFADFFFLLAYPILGVALWNLRDNYGGEATPKVIKESAIIVLLSTIIIFAFLNRPDLSADLGLAKNILNVAYSLGDVLLVALAIIELRSGQASKHKGLYLLVGFLLLQAAGDFIFAYRNNNEVYWNGDIADLLFGASAFVFALAIAQNNLLRNNKHKHY